MVLFKTQMEKQVKYFNNGRRFILYFL